MNTPNSSQTVATQLASELSSVKIPPRPAALASVENEMRSKAPNFGAMAMLISVDVGISASLLKIANSAYFGQGGRVRSVSEALQILGLNTVATSIAALSLRKVFAHVPNLERYWDSSARVALLSGWLVTQLDFPHRKIKPEEAYTFGLFRDCGIPILMSMYADYFDILEEANSEVEKSFTAIEFEAMGLDHAMIGGSLAKEWHLPIEFKAAIELHHDADAIRGLSPHIAPTFRGISLPLRSFPNTCFSASAASTRPGSGISWVRFAWPCWAFRRRTRINCSRTPKKRRFMPSRHFETLLYSDIFSDQILIRTDRKAI